MAVVLNCAKGHQWELQSVRPSPSRRTVACPICGAPTEVTPSPERVFAVANDGERTLSLNDEVDTVNVAANWEQPNVAGYEILGELGRGGMGVVYWAWQTDL